jgi:endonuclease I
MKKAAFWLVILLIGPCLMWGANLVNENIQSWTARTSYGNYTQSISAGTVNMTQCIVQPSASATGTCSIGRVQMQASTGILELPALASVGTVELHLAAGSTNRSVKLQSYNGSTWSDITTFSGIGTTGATYTHAVNSGVSTTLRLASPSHALYVHDIIISDYTLAGTISVDPSTLSGFTYILGQGPSSQQSFTVSGSGLAGNIIITPPTNYEISTLGGGFFSASNPVTLTHSGGTVNSTTIYARLKAGLSAGNYLGETISLTANGATPQSVTCNGSVSTPTILLSTSSLSGFTYMLGMGPSTQQQFSVSGSNLYASLILSAPTNFEISLSTGSGYTNSLSFTPSGNSVPLTTIYVRLKAGLAVGTYPSETLSAASTGAASQTLSLSGSVTSGAAPSAPLATNASYVSPSGFTANWNTAENATSYRLDVYTGSVNTATDLFISEYVEGSSSNKYVEIYNGTGASVDLSGYYLRLFANGTTTPTNNVQLSGTLADGACVVYKNSAAALTLPDGVTATNNTAMNFNGDDAVALYRTSTSSYVDIFGRIGEDPGDAWTSESLTTLNKTLRRKSSVTGGVTANPASGFPTLATQWDMYDMDTASGLGSHSIGSKDISYVSGYQDLNVGNVTSYPVSGLGELTEYHYLVRAVNAFGTSGNSNEISISTTSSSTPAIYVTGSMNPFSTSIGVPSATQSYTLSGANLTVGISIGIPDGFAVSTNGGTSFVTGSTSVNTDFNGSVLVRLTGSASGTYSGNITHTSTGASQVNLGVYGTVTGGEVLAPTTQASGITGYPSMTSVALEWTPGNGAYRVVKINTSNSFTSPADGSSPSASPIYSGAGEQVVFNGATLIIDGNPYNGVTITNLNPSTVYWFRIYDYNGTGTGTKYITSTATGNPQSVSTTASAGSGYYASIAGNGSNLKSALHNLIRTTHSTQFSYTATTDQIKYTDADPNNSSNVIEIYTGWSVPASTYGGDTTDWNKEHTWSKSHGDFGDTAPAGTDLHHLRACDATVNSTKNNKDFDDGGSAVTDASPPSGYTGSTGCYQTSDTWEPRPADKGDVARMIMYMAVRYEGTDTSYDLEIVDYVDTAPSNQPYYGKLATLLQWHIQDPPDARELQRNNRIAERQGNRNPFIDYPGYATRIWAPCPLGNTNVTTNSFTANWSVPLSATSYYLQVAADSLFQSLVSGYENLDVDLSTNWTVSGLDSRADTYYYRLRSYFVDDYGMYSPYMSVTLEDGTLPVELSSFNGTVSSQGGIDLLWVTQSESGVLGYYVYRGYSSGLDEAELVSSLIPATNTSTQQSYYYNDSELNDSGTMYYWLQSLDIDGGNQYFGPVSVLYDATGADGTPGIPLSTGISSLYPNPFNPLLNISYDLAKSGDVRLEIFNSRGQMVKASSLGSFNAGRHKLQWDGKDGFGKDCASGLYFIRISSGKESSIRKALLMK